MTLHSIPQTWPNYVKKKHIKQKDVICCCISTSQVGRQGLELLCHFALLRHSSNSNWKTSSIMLCMIIFHCHFIPAHHNIIMFHFSGQEPIFSFIQDNSCKAQPWCFLKMVKCVFVSVLATPIFTLLIDKFSCCQKKKKCIQRWNLHKIVQRSFQGP